MIYANFITEDSRGRNSVFVELQEIPMGYYELLREAFLARGIELNTPDLNGDKNVAFNLVIEGQENLELAGPKFLIAVENPFHNKLNANKDYCRQFSRVFTWNADMDGLGNVTRVFSPHQITPRFFPSFEQRDIFSCLINANKTFKEKVSSDLYSERIGVIRWYEKNAPDHFELYGRAWDRPPPAHSLLAKVHRSIPSLRAKYFGYRYFPSYRGRVEDKGIVLSRSKFCYCYENNRDITNYITEKIIDCFAYGCVPIYWGADNVLEYIPENCFIDRRKFRDTKEVHQFLMSIEPDQYAQYQENILNFLKSNTARLFSFEHFVATVVEKICRDIGL